MSECQQFPDTWEEFEQLYGFTDKEEVYTNGSRLMQSFRVKQWLDHIAESERKWIPVTERLPEDGERVLITHKGGVSFGWYNGSYWERGAPTNHRPLQTVIAWMPLPECYQGK